MHRKRWLVAAVLAGIASVAVALPLTASAGDANRVVSGVRYQVTAGTPLTAAGTWVACCGIDDGGSTTAVARVTGQRNDLLLIEGTHTFVGAKGTFTDSYVGTLGPANGAHPIFEGRWKFTDGTGAYAGLRGRGTFLVVLDGATGQAQGVHEGRVSGDRED